MSALTPVVGGQTPCYNNTDCIFPARCTLESAYRRYCSTSRYASVPGGTLFRLTGPQLPGAVGCDRCSSPLALIDFGSLDELGSNECGTRCAAPVSSLPWQRVVESYQTSNCVVECRFAPGELLGAARLGESSSFPGTEPTQLLEELMVAAAAAAQNEQRAHAAAEAAAARALQAALERNATAAHRASLEEALREAEAQVDVARYLQAKARHATGLAPSWELRASHQALAEAEEALREAEALRDDALDAVRALEASAPFPPSTEANAPEAEAASLYLLANASTAAAAAAAAVDGGGLRTVPLSEAVRAAWGGVTGAWGDAEAPRAAGRLLQLTTARRRGIRQVGWALLYPRRALRAFRLTLDLMIDGGDGGDGLAISYAPPLREAIEASLAEAGGGATAADSAAAAADATGATGAAAAAAAAMESGERYDGRRGVNTRAAVAETSSALLRRTVDGVPAASATGGLGASVHRSSELLSTEGAGLSVSITTRPTHSASVWFNGSRLDTRDYQGCPAPLAGTFGVSCASCAQCVGCPPCPPCGSRQECPLRPGRRFVRLAIQLHAPTSEGPSTLEVWHQGIVLFHRPVPIAGLDADASWVVAISASSGLSGHDDDHWVDNVALVAHPTQPPPPTLVNATVRTMGLAWAPPHHGGAPITLFRLQRRATSGWVTVYVGNGTQRIVGPLAEARTHLFRVQAYNSV